MGTEPTRLGSSGRDAPKWGAGARLRWGRTWAGLRGARPARGGPGRGSEDRGGACGAQTRRSRRTVGRSWWTAALREPWDSWLGSSSRRFWGCGCCCAAGGAPGAPSCGPRRIRSVGDGVGGAARKGCGSAPRAGRPLRSAPGPAAATAARPRAPSPPRRTRSS